MLIRFGLGGQLSGSVGGVVAGHNKGGQYLRNRSIPTNPNSTQQQNVRAAFATAATQWKALTTTQRSAWGAYAAETPVVNSLGESITVSGFNQYVRTNSFRTRLGAASLPNAPIVPGQSTLGTGPIITASAADGISLSVSDGNTSGTDTTLIQYGPPVSAGVNFFGGPFSFFGKTTSGANGFNDSPQLASQYGNLLAEERRAVRITAMDATGRISNTITQIVTVAV